MLGSGNAFTKTEARKRFNRDWGQEKLIQRLWFVKAYTKIWSGKENTKIGSGKA